MNIAQNQPTRVIEGKSQSQNSTLVPQIASMNFIAVYHLVRKEAGMYLTPLHITSSVHEAL